jgi:glycosyltransferase involved in cell wall biosynthesis
MRVALISEFQRISSIWIYVRALSQNLNQFDIECDIILGYFSPELVGERNVKFMSRVVHSRMSPYNLINYSINPYRVPKEYDIYHITHEALGMYVQPNHPCVITIHGQLDLAFSSPLNYEIISSNLANKFLSTALWGFRKKSAKLARKADRIICVSEKSKKALSRFLRIQKSKIDVIHHGVNHNIFKPRKKTSIRDSLNLPQNKKIVLHVGNENQSKNIPNLLDAFRRIKKKENAILVRVGQKTESIANLIRSLGLDNDVFHSGVIEPKKIPFYYNAADVFVFPSWYEGFGLPPLEAMASGCPVIASNRPSIPEIVGNAGLLIDPTDIDGLAHNISEVLGNNNLREDLIKKGSQRSKLFSWRNCARKTAKVYRRIVNI